MPCPSILALPGALSGPQPLEAVGPDFATRGLAWSVRDILADIDDGCDGFDAMTARLVHATRGREKPILLGYSLGARLALHALCTAPGNWAGAIIVSGHPGLTSAPDRAARLAEDCQWAERVRDMPWESVLAAWEDRPVFAHGCPPARWREDLRRAWQADRHALATRREAIARSLVVWSLGAQPDFRAMLTSCALPVLWLTGSGDVKFSGLGQEIAATTPGISHHMLPACGHRLPWEAPAATATAVAGWIAWHWSRPDE